MEAHLMTLVYAKKALTLGEKAQKTLQPIKKKASHRKKHKKALHCF